MKNKIKQFLKDDKWKGVAIIRIKKIKNRILMIVFK
jgi:hypothetical protein